MPRYRFTVEYFGAPFAGWQAQPGASTVQGALEQALATALRRQVRVIGAGRTDAGVHATGQVAHFDLPDGVAIDAGRLAHSVNALAGPSICIRGLAPCPPEFHARYSARSRRYLYRIALRPTALWAALSWHTGFALDEHTLQSELRAVLGKHDFLNFSIPRNDGKSTACRVLTADVEREGDFLAIRMEADRFLHKMVRSVVGLCVDVARGAHPAGSTAAVLADAFRGPRLWAPPQGLCLERVSYPDDDF